MCVHLCVWGSREQCGGRGLKSLHVVFTIRSKGFANRFVSRLKDGHSIIAAKRSDLALAADLRVQLQM